MDALRRFYRRIGACAIIGRRGGGEEGRCYYCEKINFTISNVNRIKYVTNRRIILDLLNLLNDCY